MHRWTLIIGLLLITSLSGTAPVCAQVAVPVLNQLQESINQAVARVRPSVVCVKAKKATGGQWVESVGSGFIVDRRGYILTNRHVVHQARSISVTLWDARSRPLTAHLVIDDKSLDLAVLKVAGGADFTPAPMGNANTLEIGDWVICVGSPFGFEHSASLGIVSDLHRRIATGGVTYQEMIQTDAVINQGNSGGPLIDIHGRIVGVGTAIYAPEGAYVGLGFAIPINRASHFFSRVTGAVPTAILPAAADGVAKKATNLEAPMAKSAVAAAAARPLTQQSLDAMTYRQLFFEVILKIGLVTIVSSIIFAMLGMGGGFIYVPILLSCGVDFHTATTTSLVMLTFAQFSALFTFFKSALVDVKLVAILELPTMIGAFLGGMLAHHFNISLLSALFAATLFFASYFMMQERYPLTQRGVSGFGSGHSSWEWRHEFRGRDVKVDLMLAAPLTFIIGYMGGMLGMAGGWLKVPIMVVLFNIPMKVAIASSALMVPITGFAGFLGHSVAGHFDPRLAFSLSVLTVIGAQIGSRMSIGIESSLLRFIFAFVMSLVGLWMLIRIL